jgi:hypothetical protein
MSSYGDGSLESIKRDLSHVNTELKVTRATASRENLKKTNLKLEFLQEILNGRRHPVFCWPSRIFLQKKLTKHNNGRLDEFDKLLDGPYRKKLASCQILGI